MSSRVRDMNRLSCVAAVMVAGLLVVFLASGTAYASTIYVDDDAPNDPGPGDPTMSDPDEDGSPDHPFDAIQEGIDAAINGDEVVVFDGLYTGIGNRDLDFGGKAITVRSDSGNPAACVIDCEGAGRGFHFSSGEGPNSVVEGLTITNGYGDDGGGVACFESSPKLTNCTIRWNSADDEGGGVCCRYNSNPTLAACAISGNSARDGGGLSCRSNSSPTISNCTIGGNTASGQFSDGGGVYCSYHCNPTFTNCAISGNSANSDGGGMYCHNSNPTLTNCTITGNAAYRYGGGVHCDNYSRPTLTNCILWGDTPQEVSIYESSPVVTYCDVQGGWPGMGNVDADPLFALANDFHLMPGSPCIDAGTNDPAGGLPADDLDGNARPLDGDGDKVAVADMGVYEFNPAAPSIALSPTEFQFFAPEGGNDPADQILSVRNCGGGTLTWEITGQPTWLTVMPSSGESNGAVDQVALGVEISGLPYGVYTGDLEIIDPQAVNSPRRGAVVLYVTGTLYVPSEYPTIQAAIDAAIPGDEIVLADGTYTGVGNKNLDSGGKPLTVRSASGDPTACIVDCEGDGRGFNFHSGEGPDAIVRGLTITNGYAKSGAGVWCDNNSSPTFSNCTISGNTATDEYSANGGGVYCRYNSSPTFSNCTISGNSAEGNGGGVSCWLNSSPTLTSCTISGNSAEGSGGGVTCYESSPKLTNCTISGNSADDEGGGVYCRDTSNPTLAGCAISGNSAEHGGGGGVSCWHNSSPTLSKCTISGNTASGPYSGGGGVRCEDSNPTLRNCTISGNAATSQYSDGGGVYCFNSNPTLSNCTISGNSAGNRGGGVYCFLGSPKLSNCIFWGDTPEEINVGAGSPVVTYCDVQGGGPGEGNINADPLFVDPDNDDYHLAAGSPCIDTGDPAFVPQPGETDIDGEMRVWDGDNDDEARVDMGADEFGSFRYGDLNCDGAIDTFDIDPFILALQGPDFYDPVYPDCGYVLADITRDGVVNGFDIDAFVALLIGS
ncbi:MAG: right-handed parallel beta-helix repeat-containing protein [Planctomycetes bacterium]|nr:right-handed parallel beta-helix repeat-containing protein [Planctomycetota bacterium]